MFIALGSDMKRVDKIPVLDPYPTSNKDVTEHEMTNTQTQVYYIKRPINVNRKILDLTLANESVKPTNNTI